MSYCKVLVLSVRIRYVFFNRATLALPFCILLNAKEEYYEVIIYFFKTFA